jgi:hypothetical protein
MTVAAIIQRRRDAVLDAWQRNPLVQVQAESPDILGTLVSLDHLVAGETPREAEQVGRRRTSNVVCIRRPGGDADCKASLWVASRYSGYRAAYVAFLGEAYGIRATTADLAAYDVDHLLNRARSPLDSTFIRLEAISSSINRAWGRLYESAASDPAFYANRARERRTMSWMVASKLAGLWPPDGPHDRRGITRLVDFWVSRGFPREQAEFGVTDDLNFVFRRPRRTVQPTVPWM